MTHPEQERGGLNGVQLTDGIARPPFVVSASERNGDSTLLGQLTPARSKRGHLDALCADKAQGGVSTSGLISREGRNVVAAGGRFRFSYAGSV